MSLTFKKVARDNLSKVKVYIKDSTPTSPNYFRVSDVPQVLTKGKNLLRISAHPDNLMENTPILVDVRDSNGNPIYFEIPDYLEEDKSRVISIWIYHDKDDDNTANGIATVTLIGTSKYGTNGETIPTSFAGKSNVKWQTQINVDRNRKNTSTVIFNSTSLPTLIVSESIESYENVSNFGTIITEERETVTVNYIYKGTTPIIQLTNGTLNNEMIGARINITSFPNPPTPIANIDNPLESYYLTYIKSIIDENTAILEVPFTTGFKDLEDELHTYNNAIAANGRIYYTATGSNSTTENKRSFANITLNSLDPIAGVVDKIKVLIKSSGLPGEYELLNEITIPFTSSVNVKVPIPSENLKDPNRLKIQYLNASGDISRTETISDPYVFVGGNAYIAGGENLISGSMFISNAIGSGIEIAGKSSGYIRSVGFNGQTSASLGTGPGGFIIYSGSSNMVLGEDTLQGVGMQMIGDNDDRHFIFSTAAGGNLDIKTDKFFIGTTNTQFISGSDNNIEISSSIFHLDPKNNSLVIGAGTVINATLSADEIFTPSTINGAPSTVLNASASIDSNGFAKFVSASIGGFEVSETQINSANNRLILKDNGQITGSTVLFIGGTIGGFDIAASQLNSANNSLILGADGSITALSGNIGSFELTNRIIQSTNENLILDSDGSITALAGNIGGFTLGETSLQSTNGNLILGSDGSITALDGIIGGFEIGASQISSSNDNLILKDNGQITGSSVLFSGGTIGGFEIGASQLNSANDNLILKDGGQITGSSVLFSGGTIGGMQLLSDELRSTSELAIGGSPSFSLKSNGQISGSILLARNVINIAGVTNDGAGGNEIYATLDTDIGLIDARNVGRQVVADSTGYARANVDDAVGATTTVATYIFHLMPFENTLSVAGMFTAYSDGTGDRVSGSLDVAFDRMQVSGSNEYSGSTTSDTPLTTGWLEVADDISIGKFNLTNTGATSATRVKTKVRHGGDSIYYSIPTIAQASMCRVRLKIGCSMTGYAGAHRGVRVDGFSVIATRQMAAATIGQTEAQPITSTWYNTSTTHADLPIQN